MYDYAITLDKEKDIQNWYDACTGSSALKDWTQHIDKTLLAEVRKLPRVEAYDLLDTHITKIYRAKAGEIESYTQTINQEFNNKFFLACDKLIEITGKPLMSNHFTVYLTTFPRGPYDFENAALWIAIGWFDPIKSFMHEVLHFQFIHYWRSSDTNVSKLSDEQFETLKESLTVVLDQNLEPLIKSPDKGYPLHLQIRKKLHQQWTKGINFSELVDYGVKLVGSI